MVCNAAPHPHCPPTMHRAWSLSLAAELTHGHSLRPQRALGAASSHLSLPQVTLACIFTLVPVLLQAGARLSPHQTPCHSGDLVGEQWQLRGRVLMTWDWAGMRKRALGQGVDRFLVSFFPVYLFGCPGT